MGRSRGGFSTKVHTLTDALGNPLEFVLTGGQASDIGQAETLLALTPRQATRPLSATGAMTAMRSSRPSGTGAWRWLFLRAAIAPRPARVTGLFTRNAILLSAYSIKSKTTGGSFHACFEKRARNYMGFLRFVAAVIWLR